MKIARRVWIGSLIGILGSSVSVILLFLAVALSSSWFSWTKNALSDIGVHGGVASCVFNLQVIVDGASMFLFAAIALSPFLSKKLSRKGWVLFLIGAGLSPLSGLFTEDSSPILHFVGAIGLFVILPIGLILIGSALRTKSKGRYPKLTQVAGLIALISFATAWLAFRLQLLGYGIAIPEAASYLTIYCWIISTGILCLRSSDSTFLYPVDPGGTARF